MKTKKKRMLMYWIARNYNLFNIVENNLNLGINSVYFRLYRSSGKTDYLNTSIATEINRIRNTEIDIVTMCMMVDEQEAEKFYL